MAAAAIPGGLVIVALGTVGPLSDVWIDGMMPISVLGALLTLSALALLVFGPARPNHDPFGAPEPNSTRVMVGRIERRL